MYLGLTLSHSNEILNEGICTCPAGRKGGEAHFDRLRRSVDPSGRIIAFGEFFEETRSLKQNLPG